MKPSERLKLIRDVIFSSKSVKTEYDLLTMSLASLEIYLDEQYEQKLKDDCPWLDEPITNSTSTMKKPTKVNKLKKAVTAKAKKVVKAKKK